jgi:glycosyltransferase involved in cell wall biosynthesis
MTTASGPIRILELRSVRGTGGGPEKTILQSAARSDRARFEVTVCYIRDIRDPVFSIDDRAERLPVDYVEVREKHSFDPSIWPALRRLVAERRIDIVHSHDYKTNLLAYLLAKRESIVPLSTVHGWTGHSARERYLYYPLDRRVLARFPRLVAVSSEIKSVLVGRGAPAERVTVVLNGIDQVVHRRDRLLEPVVRAELGIGADRLVVGSVGRLEPQKRYDLLIEAVAALLPRVPALFLLIAGDGSQRQALEVQAAARLPGSAYRFLGNRNDVIRLHHALDCYVQSSDYEGTSNSVLEAMAMETPLVATDVGGTSEMAHADEHALIVPPGNLGKLVSAVGKVLEDGRGAKRRAANARIRVEGPLSFDQRMRHVESVYRALVPGRVEG